MAADSQKDVRTHFQLQESTIGELEETNEAFRKVLKAAPSVTEVLARPSVYAAWLNKAQEALNG